MAENPHDVLIIYTTKNGKQEQGIMQCADSLIKKFPGDRKIKRLFWSNRKVAKAPRGGSITPIREGIPPLSGEPCGVYFGCRHSDCASTYQ